MFISMAVVDFAAPAHFPTLHQAAKETTTKSICILLAILTER